MSGLIYFIEAIGGDAIKIGYTQQDPFDRIRSLQTGNHCVLQVIGVIPGPQRLENKIHRTIGKEKRLSGEWFQREAALAIIQEYGDDFIPAERFRWIDSSVGHFCETGAFVSADDFHIEDAHGLSNIMR